MAEHSPAYLTKVPRPKGLWRRVHGVIEAVHYTPEGKVAWVLAYPRRWVHFGDRVQMEREMLLARLRRGERWFLGRRKPFLGSDGFELGPQVRLAQRNGEPFLVLGDAAPGERELDGAPLV